MAEVLSVNYTKAFSVQPPQKINVDEFVGRVRHYYDEYTLLAEIGLNDRILFNKLPAGARVIEARIVKASDGTTGQLDIGWDANGVDAVDQNGFFDGATEVDYGAGAISARMLTAAPGWNKKFGALTQVVGTAVEASTASVGDTFRLEMLYVVD